MNIPTKKLANGFEMPVYGLGMWQMGGRNERDTSNDDAADIAAIKNAIKLGVTHIDTAESYADGYTETLVGRAIKGYKRESLFLVSKVHAKNLGHDNLLASAQASLERLGTNYFDLYLLHRYSLDVPLAETMSALDALVQQGLVKNIGISNFPVEKIQEAQALTKNRIVCNQVHLNLKYREAEKAGVLRYCQEHDMMFIAWRPLQKGFLLNDISPLLQEMARKYKKTPAQIAINWLIAQKNVVTLSKTTDLAHLKENLGALNWSMDASDVEKLRNEFPDQEAISDAVPLHYSN